MITPPAHIFHESLYSIQYFIVLIKNCKSAELQHKCLLTVSRETISSRVWRKLRTWEYHHTHKSTSRELNLAKQTPFILTGQRMSGLCQQRTLVFLLFGCI